MSDLETYVYSDEYTLREIKKMFGLYNKTFIEIDTILSTAASINKNQFNLLYMILIICLMIIIFILIGLLIYIKRQRILDLFNKQQKQNHCADEIMAVKKRKLEQNQFDHSKEMVRET